MREALLLLTATGCSQVFGLDPPMHREVPTDIAIDQEIPKPTCFDKWHQGPVFPAPTLVSEVSTPVYESDPFLAADGLHMYFQRSNDFYLATRTSTQAPFGAATAIDALSSPVGEAKIFIGAGETRAWFASQRAGGKGGFDVWRGSRSDPSGTWTVDQNELDSVNSTDEQHDPHLSPDFLHLYLAPVIGGAQSIALATRMSTNDPFGAPTTLVELDAPGAQADPVLSDDELLIVFTSTETGKRHLVYATRTTKTMAFGAPTELSSLNADIGEGDSDPHITADGCTLYFTSMRTGSGDVYMSTML